MIVRVTGQLTESSWQHLTQQVCEYASDFGNIAKLRRLEQSSLDASIEGQHNELQVQRLSKAMMVSLSSLPPSTQQSCHRHQQA